MPSIFQRASRLALYRYPFRRGQERLINGLLGKTIFKESRLHVTTKHGFKLVIHPNDLIGRHLYYTGQFDRTIADVLSSLSMPGDRILDIGANIGYISCCLLTSVPNSFVVSIEPQKAIFDILQENLSQFSVERWKALYSAVSDQSGTGKIATVSGNTGAAKLVPSFSSDNTDSMETVELIDGEEIMRRAGLDRVDIIKIDVEGHEEHVLRGIASIIQQFRPRAILFECFDDLSDSHPVKRFFDSINYSLFGLDKKLMSWSLIPLEVLSQAGQRAPDYVATPNPNTTER